MSASTVWRKVRAEILAERFAFLRNYPPCPFYRPLNVEFTAFVNVTPEEQEHIMNDEVRMFLLGYESDNIRFKYGSTSDAPSALTVNPSLDPYMRYDTYDLHLFSKSAVERFKGVFIDLWYIRTYCYDMRHNRNYSLTARTVSEEVSKHLRELLQPIIENDDYDIADYGLNSLSRCVTAVKSSIKVYADIVKTIKNEALVGGQVLTMLHRARELAMDRDIQVLSEIFDEAWKIFAQRIGIWVEQGLVEDCELEFLIWPTSSLSAAAARQIMEGCRLKLDSKDYILVEDLCPSFLTRTLSSIAKCGSYVHMMEKTQVGDPLSVNWAKLDVGEVRRKVHEIEKLKSALVLKQLRTSIPFDSAIRDTMTLLLKGRDLDVLFKQEESILYKPVEEVSKQQIRRLSDIFIKGLAAKFPFVSNFKLTSSSASVFEDLRKSRLIQDTPNEPLLAREQPIVLDLLTLTYSPPAKMEKLIPNYVVTMYIHLFRVLLQLHAAINCLSDAMFEIGLMRDANSYGRAVIVTSLHRNVLDVTVNIADAVTHAMVDFETEMAKAGSIDEVLQLQKDVVHQIFRESKLEQWKKVAYLQRLVDLVSANGLAGLLMSDTLCEEYYVILEEAESLQLLE